MLRVLGYRATTWGTTHCYSLAYHSPNISECNNQSHFTGNVLGFEIVNRCIKINNMQLIDAHPIVQLRSVVLSQYVVRLMS